MCRRTVLGSGEYPQVTIGLPVFNGGPRLVGALESLVGQTYGNISIALSDNCSTDETADFCQRVSRQDARVKYYRTDSNIGAMANYARVLALAETPLFMWAAHDDVWEKSYVASLVETLEESPRAVLATGRCAFFNAEGLAEPDWGISPAAVGSPIEDARTLLATQATHWIYGLFRRPWLSSNILKFTQYDPWGADMRFLLELALDGGIAGSEAALMTKQIKFNSAVRPSSPRRVLRWGARYSRAILGTIARADLGELERIQMIRSGLVYLRGQVLPRDARGMAVLLLRAVLHYLTSADRP